MHEIDVSEVKTPAFVIDVGALEENLKKLNEVQLRAGCRVLLALKGFAMWSQAELIGDYLSGVAASSPHEARLGREEFRGEVHAYAPAYAEEDLREILTLSDHVVFNSLAQWQRFRGVVEASSRAIEVGLRVNPGHSEVETPLYDPCAPGSRLGATVESVEGQSLEGITGLHFHSLCEQGADVLERTLAALEARFAAQLKAVRWVNFGGGHHITRPDYDIPLLVELIKRFRARWDVEVYLEPGEAIAIGTGILVTTVLDLAHSGGVDVAILDTSVTAHMPDCLEMPYRPEIVGAGEALEKAHTYRLGGLSCLAGDVAGDYSFDEPLEVGQRLVFLDMAHYTMVKTTTFNGVRLPDIATWDPKDRSITVHRRFGYRDYRSRLS